MSAYPSKNFWAALSALATAAGVVVTVLIWRHGVNAENDPDPAQPAASSESEASPETGSGPWQEADTFTVRLSATFQGDECWDRHVDLDDGGAGEDLHGDSEPAAWADLIWYSCGSWQTAYLYSPGETTGLTPAGTGLDPADCNAATGGETGFGLDLDPDAPPSAHGCLFTTEGMLAGVSVDSLEWVAGAAEAELTVILWARND
ncbi:hypothetical protein AB0K52_06925 [Glycomyces sp. NPDC049804]|uniref:hypothetical protein n=1 Tax=Glycomyces sp. NPDC049804 TaxID=3154363 RepID=UPI003426A83A